MLLTLTLSLTLSLILTLPPFLILTLSLTQGLHKLVTAFEALVKSTKHFETEAVRT